MVDDNVLNWVGITLVDDTERLFGDPKPTGSNAKCFKRPQPMWEALSYLQDKEFVDLKQFAMLGFQRLGNPKYYNNLKAPFARSHVYKCYLLNLDRLKGRDFDGAVWAVEDVDFTKRLICDCFPPLSGLISHGELCLASREPPGRCEHPSWESDDSRQNELVCKIRRFGFYSKKLPGGASGTAEDGPGKKMPPVPPTPVPVPPTPVPPASDDLAAWLRALPSFGKSTKDEMDALVAKLKERHASLVVFTQYYNKEGLNPLADRLEDRFKVSPGHALTIAIAVSERAAAEAAEAAAVEKPASEAGPSSAGQGVDAMRDRAGTGDAGLAAGDDYRCPNGHLMRQEVIKDEDLECDGECGRIIEIGERRWCCPDDSFRDSCDYDWCGECKRVSRSYRKR